MTEFQKAMQRRQDMNSGKLWASEIFPWLYLGRGKDAENLEKLREHKITHIINVADDVPNFHETSGEFTYKNLGIADFGAYVGISRCFNEAFKFLMSVRGDHSKSMDHENNNSSSSRKTVLVHCANGSNRSATVVVAFVMSSENLSFVDALAFVKSKRASATPLTDNRKELENFEKKLQDEDAIGSEAAGGGNTSSSAGVAGSADLPGDGIAVSSADLPSRGTSDTAG